MNGLERKLNPRNMVDRQRRARRDLEIVKRREIAAGSLDEMSDDLGDMRAGRFLALTSGGEPTDEDASGSFMSAEGETFGDWLIRVGEVLNGRLQAGFGDGAMIFAGGDGVADETGLNLNGIRYGLRHYATDADGNNPRYGRFEMLYESGKPKPELSLAYMDGVVTSELLTNPDFETANFTGWITDGSPLIKYSVGPSGNYCGVLPTGASISQDVAVNALHNYEARFDADNYSSIKIDWYTAGAAYISSASLTAPFRSPPVWSSYSLIVQAPTDAASATITLFGSSSGPSVDNISLKEIGFYRSILFTPDPAINDGNTTKKIIGAVKEMWNPISYPVPSLINTSIGSSCTLGVHFCKVTFVDADGETLPSESSPPIVVDATHIRFNLSIPIGPWGTTARKIYMTPVTDSTKWYYALTVINNTDPAVTVAVLDSALGTLAPEYNTTGSRPLFPRHATVMAHEFRTFDSDGATKTMVITTTSSQVRYGFYTGIADGNDGDRYKADMYLDAGTYTFTFYGVKNSNSGKVGLYVDGVLIPGGPYDLYAAASTYDQTFDVTGVTVVGSGYHLIEWVVNGKNGSSSGYRVLMTFTAANQANY
jgi:hypothetical protein